MSAAWVYVFQHPYAVKVGMTSGWVDTDRDPVEQRRRDIERAAGISITRVAAFEVESKQRARVVEAWALRYLSEHRTVGEWHDCEVEEAVEAVAWAVRAAPSEMPLSHPATQFWHDALDRMHRYVLDSMHHDITGVR